MKPLSEKTLLEQAAGRRRTYKQQAVARLEVILADLNGRRSVVQSIPWPWPSRAYVYIKHNIWATNDETQWVVTARLMPGHTLEETPVFEETTTLDQFPSELLRATLVLLRG